MTAAWIIYVALAVGFVAASIRMWLERRSDARQLAASRDEHQLRDVRLALTRAPRVVDVEIVEIGRR